LLAGCTSDEGAGLSRCEGYASYIDGVTWEIIRLHFSGEEVATDDDSLPRFSRRQIMRGLYENLKEEGCLADSDIPWYVFDWAF
jgi:hypothetical protein